MADNKWTWNFDVYDESDSPTKEGYYATIDDEGNETTDYYFNEPRMTPHGIGYWKYGTRPIIAWKYLGDVADTPQTETQTQTQNSNLTFKTLEYCDICDHKGCEECIANALDEHCMPSQFNKQIEDECAKEYEELGLKELKELIEADRKTENSSEKPNNCEDEPTWEQVKEYCNKRCLDIVDSAMRKQWYKDDPQTDCPWK